MLDIYYTFIMLYEMFLCFLNILFTFEGADVLWIGANSDTEAETKMDLINCVVAKCKVTAIGILGGVCGYVWGGLCLYTHRHTYTH